MKVIISGGRDYKLSQEDINFLDDLVDNKKVDITEIVSGCASGVDTDGSRWAYYRKIRVKEFPAKWKVYGKAAGPIRNREMAEYADILIAFTGGKGTLNMIEAARSCGLIIYDKRKQ